MAGDVNSRPLKASSEDSGKFYIHTDDKEIIVVSMNETAAKKARKNGPTGREKRNKNIHFSIMWTLNSLGCNKFTEKREI